MLIKLLILFLFSTICTIFACLFFKGAEIDTQAEGFEDDPEDYDENKFTSEGKIT